MKYRKAHRKWTDSEKEYLLVHRLQGDSYEEISQVLGIDTKRLKEYYSVLRSSGRPKSERTQRIPKRTKMTRVSQKKAVFDSIHELIDEAIKMAVEQQLAAERLRTDQRVATLTQELKLAREQITNLLLHKEDHG